MTSAALVIVRPTEPTETKPPSVERSNLCNGAPGQPPYSTIGSSGIATTTIASNSTAVTGSSVNKVNVSSLDGTSASSSSGQSSSNSAEPKRPAYDPTLSERINPFDKDRIAGAGRGTSGGGSDTSITSSVASNTTSSKITTNDDTDRYTIQQGIREQPSLTGRFQAPAGGGLGAAAVPSPVTLPATSSTSAASATTTASSTSVFSSSSVSSFSAGSSGYSSATSTGFSTPSSVPPTSEQKKQEFGRTKRASSDAEIIFGDRGPDFYNKRFDRAGSRGEFRQRTESLTDAELIFGTSAVTGPATPPITGSAPFSPAASSPATTAARYGSYGSRDSTSFSSTTSDSEFVYGKKDPSVLTKSMSVASDRSASVSVSKPWTRSTPRVDDEEEFDLK
ncbi:serine-rich adhesin for platelets-like [Anopheles maculipalpis]|uniref:serine-rich adhesin for platelets-like n=1 Tax=Anopheles maculipalpis TaxID=1496333 RepID=UPI0021597031|nr:serine-rich adhesin for platelets-like [Anopheles maculipalpis]